MIYIVREIVKYEGESIVCATNNLLFAKDCYEKQKEKVKRHSDVWVVSHSRLFDQNNGTRP